MTVSTLMHGMTSSSAIEFRILGPADVSRDNRPLLHGGRMQPPGMPEVRVRRERRR
jgi:hypothetical protein